MFSGYKIQTNLLNVKTVKYKIKYKIKKKREIHRYAKIYALIIYKLVVNQCDEISTSYEMISVFVEVTAVVMAAELCWWISMTNYRGIKLYIHI